jgi:hypothetical protein
MMLVDVAVNSTAAHATPAAPATTAATMKRLLVERDSMAVPPERPRREHARSANANSFLLVV